jgi:hypothetical protein
MALMVVAWLFGIYILTHQAIYSFRTGQVGWFFMNSPSSTNPVTKRRRIAYAFIFVLSAAAMIAILGMTLAKAGINCILNWLSVNYGLFVVSLIFIIFCVVYLPYPQKAFRWMLPDNPELWDNKLIMAVFRAVCIGLLGMAAIILSKL